MGLLQVKELKTHFFTLDGVLRAVDGVSFEVSKGVALAIAGESGCGKTTTALSILRLIPPPGKIVEGQIFFKGTDLIRLKEDDMRRYRWKEISLVFQGAMNALNPVFKVGDQIVDVIMLHERVDKTGALERAKSLLEMVGIPPSRYDHYPHELSGGMKQRIMIAMSLACNPELVIADEPSTALDVITQAQILNLIRALREKLELSIILITHDLSVIAAICDKVAVMYAGEIVEQGDIGSIYNNPAHPYTQALIGSFPSIKGRKKSLLSLPGAPPNLIFPPPGCRFHPRCQHAKDVCRREKPTSIMIDANHRVACHLLR